MNSKETIVRNCIEAKRREADSYQNPGCYNAAFCRGYVEGASETLSTMLSPAENSTEAFLFFPIILMRISESLTQLVFMGSILLSTPQKRQPMLC